MELFLYARAACVVALTEAFRRDLEARGVAPERIEVVTNGADLSLFAPAERDPAMAKLLGLENRFVSGYLGTHGLAHGLDTLLDAAKLLEAEAPGRHAVLFAGEGAEKARLVARASAENIRNVVFLPAVPKAEAAKLWTLLDCALVPLRRDPVFATVLPSKLFEAMATGVPVVLGVEGEARDLLAAADAGLAVPPEDAAALADAVLRLEGDPALRARLRENALRAAPRFERGALAARMLAVLERVALAAQPAARQKTGALHGDEPHEQADSAAF